MPQIPSQEGRFEGCLLGLAIGDALGAHFEGQSPDWLHRRYPTPASLLQSPPQSPWYYTDDTQMAMGVAEALIADQQIVEETLCAAFVANYTPSRGYGRGARMVLDAMREGQDYTHWTNELFPGGSYGNGAAMRVAPIGLLFHNRLDDAWEQARLSALPTHVHPLGIEGAQLIALAVAISQRSQQIDATRFLDELARRCQTSVFRDKLEAAKHVQDRDDLRGLGNGIAAQDSVVTAIACYLLWPDSYEQVLANAILLGGDTDTIAAMAGAISGAHLGIGAIPAHLQECLEDGYKGRRYLTEIARQMSAACR